MKKVAVCILTYRRAEGLSRLLQGLAGLRFSRVAKPELSYIVVDNDERQSGREVCEAAAESLGLPIRYVCENNKGISHARNRALEEARDSADMIAFIDDDEVPEPDWLDQLMFTQQDFRADVVAGPVLPYFPQGAPEWIVRGNYFQRLRPPTGVPILTAGAGNVLIQTSVLKKHNARFDERFGLSGGEDTHFFMGLDRKGARMVWCNEAVAHEWVPSSRTKLLWLLRRSYRSGNTYVRSELDWQPRWGTIVFRVLKALFRIGFGLAGSVATALFGLRRSARFLLQVCAGIGMLTGLAGMRYYEYKQTHSV